ncbi:MAG TPA: cyclophilin-like fold protein [Mucilaginibacter sp.]|nr:cyclophilin-like fold protein [Mucilaginibacter sp.]
MANTHAHMSTCKTGKKNRNLYKRLQAVFPTFVSMKLKITISEKAAFAQLYDNPAARDFAALLPLTLELEDYNRTEKISQLPEKLSSEDAPRGFQPSAGDLTYYEPWGNIALFYKDFGYANGLIPLGRITSGLEAFTSGGTMIAKFELVP